MTASCLSALCPPSELDQITELLQDRKLEPALQRALALTQREPHNAEAWNLLAHLQRQTAALDAALTSIERAVALEPTLAHHHVTRALVLDARAAAKLADNDAALASLDRAIALDPRGAHAFYLRGSLHQSLGQLELARADFTQAVALNPEHQRARFKLAALTGAEAPSTAPTDYVQHLFDNYAQRFETHLVAGLGYCAPQALAEAFAPHAPDQPIDILDLGCGTGLTAPLFRPWARQLDGVDLSANMLREAAAKQLYDSLHHAEINQHLQHCTHQYDLAIAADVLCYLGDLAPTWAALTQRIRPGGWVVFSVERGDAQDVQLQPNGRYRHSMAYLERLSAEHGFSVVSTASRALRTEGGAPVHGQVVLMQYGPSTAGAPD